MIKETDKINDQLDPDYLKRIYKSQLQGAYVRSGASLFMWLLAALSLLVGHLNTNNVLGITAAVVYLIFMNPPVLWGLRRIKRRKILRLYAIGIHALEIFGYTTVIHCIGGIKALYMSPLYAALITFVGAMGPPRQAFIVAGMCSAALIGIIGLEYVGLLENMCPFSDAVYPVGDQILIVLANIFLLFIVAFMTAYTGSLLKRSKRRLREKNQELVRASCAKSEFLANMSHELRTPLNHIIGFTDLILSKKVGHLTDTQEEYLGDVKGSSHHLLALINDILDISKIESGTVKLEYGRINLAQLLENSLVLVKEKAMKHAIDVRLKVRNIPETVLADELRLKQILYNLLSNAVKFTPERGSVTVKAKLSLKGLIKVKIIDTGVGLDSENIDRIFEPFEQVEGKADKRFQGTGLGLAITKKMVELHGGKIWAESKGEGRGSTFSFTIPVSTDQNTEKPVKKTPEHNATAEAGPVA